ncbi:MAG: nucleotidyltransferase domain-containing protein [Bacteroidales bacterium]
MLQQILKDRLPFMIEEFKKHKIKRVFVFGSACTNHFNENSDLDFLISFKEGIEPLERGELWWSLYDTLKLTFNREIDLLTENQLKNPYFIQEINKTRQLIYGE